MRRRNRKLEKTDEETEGKLEMTEEAMKQKLDTT
jgi:hypothetical protein